MSSELKNIYACSPATTRGHAYHLGGDKKKAKNFLYCCGNGVVIRNLENPLECDLYLEHTAQTTVARYSPSGFYIASADVTGTVRIWDTVNAEHVLKIELRVMSGPIVDLSWSEDSKRICVCGEGREAFGNVFMFDSGSTVGEIGGHSKPICSIDFKQNRPYRIATGGEDNQVNFYAGPPFKFGHANKEHTRFVNCVRFAPDGSRFITVGSDGKGYFYDGKTGEKVAELSSEGGHTGSIYSVCWSPDSSKLLTAGADKTARIYSAETGTCETVFTIAEKPTFGDMQVGCLWQKDTLMSLSLDGSMNYLNIAEPSKPAKIVHGHNKFITSIDVSNGQLYSGSYDGTIIARSVETGETKIFGGKPHTNQVNCLKVVDGKMYTCAMDDCVAITDVNGADFGTLVKLESTPYGVAVDPKDTSVAVVATRFHLVVLSNGEIKNSVKIAYEASSVSISSSSNKVVVGGDDSKLHVYTLDGTTLAESAALEKHRSAVVAVEFSPDGSKFASADKSRDILVWDATTNEPIIGDGWCFHNSTIRSIAWSADGVHIASGALDGDAIVWNLEAPKKRIHIKNANMKGVHDVVFIDSDVLVTAGVDCCIKTWNLTY